MMNFNFNNPTNLIFGSGALNKLGNQTMPGKKALLMISKAFAEFFIEKHACDEQFIKIAKAMGIDNADKPEDFITALAK